MGLYVSRNNTGDEGARLLAAALYNNASLTVLDLNSNDIDDQGAQSLAEALKKNEELTALMLYHNNIGDEGARSLAEALVNNATLTDLDLCWNNIGAEGARALAAALDTNRTLLVCSLSDEDGEPVPAHIMNRVADRLRVNELVLKVDSLVASALARRVELWDDTLIVPPVVAARAAVLAFGDELLDLTVPPRQGSPRITNRWLSPGGREFAAAYLLPLAEAALRQELQRLAEPSFRAR
jgi:Ran GTPase-activating protein (RanGAP) involved in mRNA processing and transport